MTSGWRATLGLMLNRSRADKPSLQLTDAKGLASPQWASVWGAPGQVTFAAAILTNCPHKVVSERDGRGGELWNTYPPECDLPIAFGTVNFLVSASLLWGSCSVESSILNLQAIRLTRGPDDSPMKKAGRSLPFVPVCSCVESYSVTSTSNTGLMTSLPPKPT